MPSRGNRKMPMVSLLASVAVIPVLLSAPARAQQTYQPFQNAPGWSLSLAPEDNDAPEGDASVRLAPSASPAAPANRATARPGLPGLETEAVPEVVDGREPAGPAATPGGAGQPATAPGTPPAQNAATAQPDSVFAVRLARDEVMTHPRFGKKERESLREFYAARGNKPLWIEGESWTQAARDVMAKLGKAYEDALDPSDYPLPTIDVLPKDNAEAALADADIRLSVLATAYARDARGGRIEPGRISRLITPKLDLPEPAALLQELAGAAEPARTLGAYNPSQPGYLALKAKLAEIRASRPSVPTVRVPPGQTLKVGMRDPRVPLVRVRFGLFPTTDDTYDERVAAAVADFQRENGLLANGVLNRQTLLALAGVFSGQPSAAANEGDIVANMERWRWLPRDMGQEYILVSIPDYAVRIVRDGAVVHQARVIVGKPESPTPVFSNEMQYAIVNPSWYVPPSILKNEFLPRLARDPNYAARLGYVVVRRGNSISVRQPPGERNALGHIKFMFPNDHAVYLHDTPSRALFGNDKRAFSHGCVRVDQPLRFAEIVLGGPWTETKVKSLIGRGERTIRLEKPIPIHLTYFTLSVENGRLVQKEDIYGYNSRVKAALKADR